MNRFVFPAQDRRRPKPSYSQLAILLLLSTPHSGLVSARAPWRAKTGRKPGVGARLALERVGTNRRSALEARFGCARRPTPKIKPKPKPKPRPKPIRCRQTPDSKTPRLKRSDDFRFSNLPKRRRPQASATLENLRRALGLLEIGQKSARSGSLPCIPMPPSPSPRRQMNPARFGKTSGALISNLSTSGLPDGIFARLAKPNAERETAAHV